VSADGSVIVGISGVVEQGIFLPARWSADGSVMALGAVRGHTSHTIIGASADASIVYGISNGGGPNSLWRWTQATGIVVLEEGTAERDFLPAVNLESGIDPPPGRRKVSSDGAVVVGAFDMVPDGWFQEIFRWTESGGVELLPLNPKYTQFRYRGMTTDGKWIFGQAREPINPSDEPFAPWIWSKETGLLDLMDALRAQGLGPAIEGWKAFSPHAISANGLAIGGHATNPNGFTEAFVIYLDSLAPLAGDFNADGTVNAADYVVWRNGLGTTHTQADYDLWHAHFGQTAGTSGATAGLTSSANAAVPEPGTAALTVFAISQLLLLHRTHHPGLPGWKRVCKPDCTPDETTRHRPARLGGAMFPSRPHQRHRSTQTSCEGTNRLIKSASGFQTSAHGASSCGAESQ
jgi:uncharacterized membrane protein